MSQFIVIADKCLGIFPQYIFHWTDLHHPRQDFMNFIFGILNFSDTPFFFLKIKIKIWNIRRMSILTGKNILSIRPNCLSIFMYAVPYPCMHLKVFKDVNPKDISDPRMFMSCAADPLALIQI